jgi:hypothetical protein
LLCCKSKEKTVSANITQHNTETENKDSHKILGKLLFIIPNITEDEETFCAGKNCKAAILIEKIYRTPANKSFIINEGDSLEVTFRFSLDKVEMNDYNGIKISLPGLKINDKFEADIFSQLSIEHNTTFGLKSEKHIIKTYVKKE